MIVGDNKGWADDDLIDDENGNFDYLMYNDIDFKHPEVIKTYKIGLSGLLKLQALKVFVWML